MPFRGKRVAYATATAGVLIVILGAVFYRSFLVESYSLWRLRSSDTEARDAAVERLARVGTERSLSGLWQALADSVESSRDATLAQKIVGALSSVEARVRTRPGTVLLRCFWRTDEPLKRRSAVVRFLMESMPEALAPVIGAMIEHVHGAAHTEEYRTPSSAELRYRRRLNELPRDDAFQYSCSALHDSEDIATIAAVLKDLREVSRSLGKAPVALRHVERFLAEEPLASAAYQDAFLTKAFLLDPTPSNSDLFRAAHSKGWKTYGEKDPLYAYKRALFKHDPAQFPSTFLNLSLEDKSGEIYRNVGDYLTMFACRRLWPERTRAPEFSAMANILPRLEVESATLPARLARAICLLLDRRYGESLSILEEIEASLSASRAAKESDRFEDDEWRNLPLYVAAVQLLKGASKPEVQAPLAEFADRNRRRPDFVAQRAMRISSTIYRQQGHGVDFPVTSFLVERFLTDESFVRQVRKRYLWHVVDVFVTSSPFSGQAKYLIRKDSTDSIDPSNHPGRFDNLFVAAYNYMLYQAGNDQRGRGDLELAEATFRRMLEFNRSGRWNRVARAELVQTLIASDRPVDEILPLTERLVGYGLSDEGWEMLLERAALMFQRYQQSRSPTR